MQMNFGRMHGKVAANRCMENSTARNVPLERAHFRRP